MTMRPWLQGAALLSACALSVAAAAPAPASVPHLLPALSDGTRSKLELWFRHAGRPKQGESFGSYLVRVAYLQHGAPYDDVVVPPGVETPRVDLDRFECVTFLESSLAVARCGYRGEGTAACFAREIVASRYRDGTVTDYSSRLHYFVDWIEDNGRRGRLVNLSADLGGVPVSRDFTYVSHRLLGKAALSEDERATLERELGEIEDRLSRERHLVVPRERSREALAELQDGDLVAFVRDRAGLLVSHAGFVYRVDGRPRLLHASSFHHRVVLTPDDVASYLLRRPERRGVIVARPLAP